MKHTDLQLEKVKATWNTANQGFDSSTSIDNQKNQLYQSGLSFALSSFVKVPFC